MDRRKEYVSAERYVGSLAKLAERRPPTDDLFGMLEAIDAYRPDKWCDPRHDKEAFRQIYARFLKAKRLVLESWLGSREFEEEEET